MKCPHQRMGPVHVQWPWPLLSALVPLHLSRLLLIVVIMSSSPPSLAADYGDLYATCSKTTPFMCGTTSYSISYPFNHISRSSSCGRPGYSFTCDDEDSVLMLETGGKPYRVLDVNYPDRSLTVADPMFYEDPCSSWYPLTSSATVNLTLFGISPKIVANISLITCTSSYTVQSPGNISCSYSYWYYSNEDGTPAPNSACNVSQVQMNQTTLRRLESSSIGLSKALQGGFTMTWTAGGGPACDGCAKRGGVCIYNDTSGGEECVCSYGLCPGPSGKSRHTKAAIAIGITAALAFLLICSALLFYTQRQILHKRSIVFHSESNNRQRIEAFLEENGYISPVRYKYSDIKRMTKSFREKLGHGGYGTVFRGTLQDGRLVAVKMLNSSKGDGQEFINEVASIGRTSHVNVVRLLGFCLQGQKRSLVYEFMPNGSLDKFICSDEHRMRIGWKTLHAIAVGIARGLEYLHRGCNTRIVHFDIKPHNILLDDEFCPKISDFGLAKLCSPKDSIISMLDARGTAGYIAPEVFCRNFGAASTKSDVYSYGMMVLEMTGATTKPTSVDDNSSEAYFPQWVYKELEHDGDLQGLGENSEIAKKLILVGLWCIQTMPANRPSIRRVIEMLEGKIGDIEHPPLPSYLSPPLLSVLNSSS